jgi:hypothetical protein
LTELELVREQSENFLELFFFLVQLEDVKREMADFNARTAAGFETSVIDLR